MQHALGQTRGSRPLQQQVHHHSALLFPPPVGAAAVAPRLLRACRALGDVYFIYLEGQRLTDGENPYARMLASDMLHNDKYASSLTGTYLAGAAGITSAPARE